MAPQDDLSRPAGGIVADHEDEHVRFSVYLSAIERMAADPDALKLLCDLLVSDPDQTMAQSAALRVLEPDSPSRVVDGIAVALADRPLIAQRVSELRRLPNLSNESFTGDPETELREASGWFHETLAERSESRIVLSYLSESGNRRRAREVARRRLT